MFDYLQMACTDSDYIVVIIVPHLPKFIILALKLTLVLELRVAFDFPSSAIAQTPASTFVGNTALWKGLRKF